MFAELAMELGKDKMTEEAEKMGFGSSFTIDGAPTLASSYDVSKAETRDLAGPASASTPTWSIPCT